MARSETLPSRREVVLTKAVCNAAGRLGLSQAEMAALLGVSAPTASRMFRGEYFLHEARKEFEFGTLLLRLFRSLDAITGGDSRVNAEWMRNANSALGGIPAELIRTTMGLVDVVTYLDSRRAPL
ncbi:XRE family transcriptional regulator [Tropicimonas sp. IMCC6043]|uniref:MbcA/ParS/Xre antitoxin family protein n=1 Tax=Tropicimonas sp. IMCC6043 TaxID=2510645 RepID=UPI00101D27AD|nr:XRE family transcriptional regulator [Tropicimonas sp. IMCC6043]RYH09598.1 XRE family transcriptional regulator [Tropicimonas sp. IMCC6043]